MMGNDFEFCVIVHQCFVSVTSMDFGCLYSGYLPIIAHRKSIVSFVQCVLYNIIELENLELLGSPTV